LVSPQDLIVFISMAPMYFGDRPYDFDEPLQRGRTFYSEFSGEVRSRSFSFLFCFVLKVFRLQFRFFCTMPWIFPQVGRSGGFLT